MGKWSRATVSARARVRAAARSTSWLAFGLAAVLVASAFSQPRGPPTAALLAIDGAIGPATSSYVVKELGRAAQRGAPLVVLEIDTPGGLDTSMREIIQAILASPIPVVGYVSPSGARAASAGTYILYATHVAAMAPATNLGAATPISIGGPATPAPAPAERGGTAPGDAAEPVDRPTAEENKAVNDAVAYIRGLAELRGRDADWAESAVRSAASLSASVALERRVIDLVADDLGMLLERLDGRSVEVAGRTVTLETRNLAIERVEPNWRTRLLSVLTNPTVAYMLMLVGIYGLLLEGFNPGAVVPGVVGAIALLLALFAFQVLPVNYAGFALIALGVALMVAEFMVPSFGALGLGGVAAFVFGSVILIDTDVPGFGVPLALLATLSTAGALAVLGVAYVAVRTRKLPVVSGIDDLRRDDATALEDFAAEGYVAVRGERWKARSPVPVRKGQRLRIVAVADLVLEVEPYSIPQPST